MTRWEYKQVSYGEMEQVAEPGMPALSVLAELGRDGWELVTVVAGSGAMGHDRYFLKRPLVSKSDESPLEKATRLLGV